MTAPVLKKRHSFLAGRSKEEFLEELCQCVSGKVNEAYIFGSFLTEDFGADSDLDLILICETQTPFMKRRLDFPELDNLGAPLDVLIYTPTEFEKLKSEGRAANVGFWKSVVTNLKRIY